MKRVANALEEILDKNIKEEYNEILKEKLKTTKERINERATVGMFF